MRIIIVLVLSNLFMKVPFFDTLLGKDISEALSIGVTQVTAMDNLYMILEPKVDFFGKSIGQIGVETSEDNTINSITIFFPEIVDTSYYKIISEYYGYTSNILVVDEILQEESSEKTNDENFTSNIKERITSLKKGSIEHKEIDHVLWDKDDFQIQLHFGHNNNRMYVRFANKIYN
ncbi:hypothetical protein SAMN05421766_10192 [Zobellia uliginosa]|uniref:Uncharacterized protein n=1 Tax=Zobellia uliginosa TaxID=143224 RepID=A0ABY1KHU1_9FLAO|nr:hypothetical protein [Zobellia uliginosa]SIS37337.1 hypothetical protein SAMN05421766_10192 [Zobellia uliginosa]